MITGCNHTHPCAHCYEKLGFCLGLSSLLCPVVVAGWTRLLLGHMLTETPLTFLWLSEESISCFPEINPGLQLWGATGSLLGHTTVGPMAQRGH